jgi:hypothetical protein
LTLDCAEVAYTVFSVIFLLILAGGIVGGLLFRPIIFAAAGGAWLIYQLMGCCNKSTKYIWNLETLT